MVKTRVLVVEDEAMTAIDIQDSLLERGYEVADVVATGLDAIQAAGTTLPDVILMDIRLQGEMNGIEAAREIHKEYDIPVIFATAYSDDLSIVEATSSAPVGYLLKPFNERELKIALELGIYQHKKERELIENERTIRALINAVVDALLLVDDTCQIVALNESMAVQLGRPVELLLGMNIEDLCPGALGPDQVRIIQDTFHTGSAAHFEAVRDARYYETHIYPIKELDGHISRIVIQSQDITLRKSFEERLKTEGIQQLEKNMEQFQILNDQIRNPLQVIKGYVELSNTPFRQEIDKQITAIDNLVTRLDAGWLESEKVREFLTKHYLHHTQNAAQPPHGSG